MFKVVFFFFPLVQRYDFLFFLVRHLSLFVFGFCLDLNAKVQNTTRLKSLLPTIEGVEEKEIYQWGEYIREGEVLQTEKVTSVMSGGRAKSSTDAEQRVRMLFIFKHRVAVFSPKKEILSYKASFPLSNAVILPLPTQANSFGVVLKR